MNRAWLFPVFIAAVIATIVAVMGATITDIGPWYHSLIQPRWAPPDAVYGIAWTAIYAFTAAAGVTGWVSMREGRMREWLLGLFALNGFFNILWSLLFFRFHRPDWAVIEVVFLWLSIVLLIVTVRRSSRGGAWLLAPYLVWVTFAGFLNLAVVRLNGPIF